MSEKITYYVVQKSYALPTTFYGVGTDGSVIYIRYRSRILTVRTSKKLPLSLDDFEKVYEKVDYNHELSDREIIDLLEKELNVNIKVVNW